jgi:hypothetical protein
MPKSTRKRTKKSRAVTESPPLREAQFAPRKMTRIFLTLEEQRALGRLGLYHDPILTVPQCAQWIVTRGLENLPALKATMDTEAERVLVGP